ncbi:MAG: O-antigen ligase family protein [Candidatus Aerophobetes bacterium]|nr:O-antigen ligase family protein [Candidatus Aerophobetes bacterium]
MFFITPLVFYAWATTFTITKNTVGEIILLVITALWVIKLAEGGNYPSLKFPLSLPIIFFSAALLISLFQTHTYYTSFLDLARWSSYILLYFIITSCLREKKWMKGLLIAILSASLIASSYAIFQFYGIDFPFWRRLSGRTRLFSTFGNPNYLSGHLAACLPLAFAFFCLSKKRLLSGIPILVLYAGVLITNIGGCIALFGGGIFILLTLLIYEKNFLKRNRSSLLYLILALIIVTAIYSTHNPLNPKEKNVVAEGASYTSFEYGSTQQRFLIWLSTYQMIKEHPFLGSGVGTFRIHYPSAQGKVLSREKNRRYISQANKSINAHNDYLHIWAETGIIGLIFFIWIIAVFYKKTFFYLKKAKKEEKFFLIGFAAGGVAILIHALFSFPFHIIQNGLLFFAFLSLSTLIGEKRIEEKENKEKEKREGKRFILPRRAIQVSAVLLAILLGTLRVKLFIADTHIKTAEMMMKEKAYPLAVSELIKALKIDNDNGLAFANLGENYGHLRLYTKSFYALKKAEINWIYPHLYNNLGCSYIGMKKWVKAEEMFKKNIFLFPNSPNAYFNLGSLFLLKAKKNILHENIELAKKNLDKAFTSYEQGRVFKPDFSLPSELREAYSKVGEENSEGKTLSSFSFFTPESSPFLDILIPPMKCGEEEYLRLFFYLPPEKNYTSISKINIEIKDEGRLIENFTLKKKISPFYNIISIPYKAPAKGRYRVIVRVRYGRGKVILAKKNFSLGG